MKHLKEILIVDDSLTARLIIRRCVEMAGYTIGICHHAEDGIDALGMLREHPETGLVITDLNMPKMDGITLVKHIRATPLMAHIPLVVVSSLSLAIHESDLSQLDADALVQKPISPEKVGKALGAIFKEASA